MLVLAQFTAGNYALMVVGRLVWDSVGRGPETTNNKGFWEAKKGQCATFVLLSFMKTLLEVVLVAKGSISPFLNTLLES